MYEALGSLLSIAYTRFGIHTCNPSVQETEAGRSRVQGHSWLNWEIEVSLNSDPTEEHLFGLLQSPPPQCDLLRGQLTCEIIRAISQDTFGESRLTVRSIIMKAQGFQREEILGLYHESSSASQMLFDHGMFLLGNKWFISDLYFKQFRWKYGTENQEQIGEEEKEGEDCGGDWKLELSSCTQV